MENTNERTDETAAEPRQGQSGRDARRVTGKWRSLGEVAEELLGHLREQQDQKNEETDSRGVISDDLGAGWRVESRRKCEGDTGNCDALIHPLPHQPCDEKTERRAAEPDHQFRCEKLSLGEIEVLRVLARKGSTNKAIARDLGVSPETVKLRLRSASYKLRLRNRTAVAVWFWEMQDRGGHLSAPLDDGGAQGDDGNQAGDHQGDIGKMAPARAGG